MSKRERIEALEARVAVAEKRLSALEIEPSDPDEAMPSGCFDCDGTTCRCADPEPDPAPVPEWRALVDDQAAEVEGYASPPLASVLFKMAHLAKCDPSNCHLTLACIVAVAEGQVGDGWKADPGRVPHGHWGITWLLAMLSHEPPNWPVVADRSAAWLRDLADGAS